MARGQRRLQRPADHQQRPCARARAAGRRGGRGRQRRSVAMAGRADARLLPPHPVGSVQRRQPDPQLAVTGLTGADLSTEGLASPLDADTDVLSRASLFDLRSGSDPFSHDPDIRLDAALDFALYPTGQQTGDLGLRGSLGQRLSWSDAAFVADPCGPGHRCRWHAARSEWADRHAGPDRRRQLERCSAAPVGRSSPAPV